MTPLSTSWPKDVLWPYWPGSGPGFGSIETTWTKREGDVWVSKEIQEMADGGWTAKTFAYYLVHLTDQTHSGSDIGPHSPNLACKLGVF